MNGVHDMGGMDGFGKVEPEPNEPMFHTEWEARVLAMVRAMGAAGAFNIDTSRFYREALPPHVYLSSSYYKKWFLGLEDLLLDKGYVAAEDLAAGHAVQPPKPLKHGKFDVANVERVMVRGQFGRDAAAPAKFKAGRSGPREKHSPGDAHAVAALRARPCRRGRARPRLSCVSGLGRDGSRRKSAMALHRRVRRRRAMGAGCRPDRQNIHRRVRAVSGAGLMDAASARVTGAVPGIPRDDDGPVFREPWEAQAFAMALVLHERGLFTWNEWAATLADEIKRAQAAGDPDTGETYYRHWLATLERLIAAKGVATSDTLHRYRDAWDHAADRTPHGSPIELKPEDFSGAATHA